MPGGTWPGKSGCGGLGPGWLGILSFTLQRGGDGGHNLPNQMIEIGMYDIQVALT